jgi:hypothetical protein
VRLVHQGEVHDLADPLRAGDAPEILLEVEDFQCLFVSSVGFEKRKHRINLKLRLISDSGWGGYDIEVFVKFI